MEKALEPIKEHQLQTQDQYNGNNSQGIYFNIKLFEHSWRLSKSFSMSNMVPTTFRNKPENCMIAINMASRFDLDPFFIMQNIYIIHSTPAMSSQFMIALLNKSNKFEPLQYKFIGVKGQSSYGCIAYTKHLQTGIHLESTPITWEMVENEGWSKKAGSKWKTMPDQMFRYRAAAFFCRVNAPEILMGMLTENEVEDIGEEKSYSEFSINETVSTEENDNLIEKQDDFFVEHNNKPLDDGFIIKEK